MILVCGEALMDVIVEADGSRQPVPGGGPFNTARALAHLGVPTAFLGRLSEDAFGDRLASRLVEVGASLALASRGPEPTTLAIARVDSTGVAQYEFQIRGTSAPNFTPEMLPERLGPEVAALHVGTLGLVLEPIASTLAALVRREVGHRLVMLDPNIRSQLILNPDQFRERLETDLFPVSTVVKASEPDLAWLYPHLDPESACEHILTRGPRLVIATVGSAGAFGLSAHARVHVGAPRVEVVDTIGAGDVFGAALLAWLYDHELLRADLCLEADQLAAALRYACLAASLSCRHAGAALPSRVELHEAEAGTVEDRT